MMNRAWIAGLALVAGACNGPPGAGGTSTVEEADMPREPLAASSSPGTVAAGMEDAVAAARDDLARRLGIDGQSVTVLEARSVTWSAGHLGCPAPGMMYPQVLTPGVLIVLEADGLRHLYHGGTTGAPRYCPADRALPPSASGPSDR